MQVEFVVRLVFVFFRGFFFRFSGFLLDTWKTKISNSNLIGIEDLHKNQIGLM